MKENLTFDEINHKYRVGDKDYVSVTQLLDRFGLSDFSAVPYYLLEQSKEFGTIGHKSCQLLDEGTLGFYDNQFKPWLNGYKKFLAAFKPKWEHIELPLVSRIWGFAGTPDRIGAIKGRTAIVDLKFGTAWPSHRIQTAGYKILAEENLKIKVKDRYSVYIMEDTFELDRHTEKSDKSVFLSIVQVYNWLKKNDMVKE